MKKINFDEKKRYSHRIFILFGVCMALFLPLMSNPNIYMIGSIDSNIDSKDDYIIIPRISGDIINITTPENKTYAAPMSGYYPGTYGFENDIAGSNPSDFTVYENNGAINIISSLDGHEMVLECDDPSLVSVSNADNFFNDIAAGTIEAWFRTNNSLNGFAMILVGDSGFADGITFVIRNNQFQYFDTSYHTITSASSDTWYHVRIEFDCTDDWHLWIDGISQDGGSGYNFRGSPTLMDGIRVGSGETDKTGKYYYDAIGYSWDPNYAIGDNLNEGFLLSYENSTNLEWTGYSLDSQSNVTIVGNTTIPMLNEGKHTIQLFGNNSLGNIYMSDVRSFTISSFNILTPENKTYVAPMSGYYPGTFGFENDIGKTGDAISWVDWASPSGVGEVIDVMSGHEDVLRLVASSTTQRVDHYSDLRENGTIEFYHMQTANDKETEIYYYDTSLGYGSSIRFRFATNGYIQYYTSSTWNNIVQYNANTWYHVKIEFDCSDDWHLWINSASMDGGVGYNYDARLGTPGHLNRFIYQTISNDFTIYLDAYGESWNPNYDVDDNLNEGLLLSFENGTSLEWMGYSLDGNNNVTITGNTTIPMLNEGKYTIQIFGNNSFGDIFHSNRVYFIVDENAPTTMMFFTPYNETNNVNKSTEFILIADDGSGSGVFVTKYRINNSAWIDYFSPFTLSDYDSGYYNISYYSIDNANHIESQKSTIVNLIIDETADENAPITIISFIPHFGTNVVKKTTEFVLTADDGSGSGVFVTKYRINNSAWIEYTNPFNLSNYDSGIYNISYYSIDNENNTETQKSILIVLIENPPGTEIPGYDLMFIVGIVCVMSMYILKKRNKLSK